MKRLFTIVAAVTLGLTAAGVAIASRDSSGTYSRPSGNPVVSGTTISSTWANNLTSDIASELTNSLDRNGRGAMLAPLQGYAGTVAAPGYTFSSDTDSGFYRIGADNLGVAIGGTKAVDIASTGVGFPLGLNAANGTVAAPSITFTSDTDTGLYRIGANNIGIAANGVKTVDVATTGVTLPLGLTVTQSQTDTRAGTFTGNGTAEGIRATGGAAASNGGQFYSTGSGFGAYGESATGTGVKGYASGSGGTGIVGQANNNGNGGSFTGQGTGDGVTGVGGATGRGGYFVGGGIGVQGAGGGTSVGGTFANGTAATSGTPRNAVALTNGYLSMNGVTYPSSSTVVAANTLTPANLNKAWVSINSNGTPTTVTVEDGFNIASVARTAADTLRITFATAMANATFAAICSSSDVYPVYVLARATTYFDIRTGFGGTTNDFDGDSNVKYMCTVFGTQ